MTVFERGWLSSNNILFMGREDTVLVDSGYATHAAQTLALAEQALDGRPLDILCNTHLHSDHCGGNAALQARYAGLRTLIPPGDAPLVRQWDEAGLSFQATGQECPRFTVSALLEPGRNIRLGDIPWQIHAAPGHDPHSIILFEPASRVLISADALWENGFGVVFPELAGEPGFAEVAATLDLIEALQPVVVVPGHGRPFTDVDAALVRARQRLEGQIRNPTKHAWHALKVLVKFKLLEVGTMQRAQFQHWIEATPYMDVIRSRFFAGLTTVQLGDAVLEELVHARLLVIEDDRIRNG